MMSNKQIIDKLTAQRKKASALKQQANKRVSTNKAMDIQILNENIRNRKALGGNLNKIGYKRNKVFVGNTTQKIFSGTYNAKNPINPYKTIDVRGSGDIISPSRHQGIVDAGRRYADVWAKRSKYAY